MKNFRQLTEDMKQNPELSEKVEELDHKLRKNYYASMISALADLGYHVTESELLQKKEFGKLDEETLSDVSGGTFWLGDDAPDGHEIGCFLSFTYYGFADEYCYAMNGRHDFSSGRTEFGHNRRGRRIQRCYCKCGKCLVEELDRDVPLG